MNYKTSSFSLLLSVSDISLAFNPANLLETVAKEITLSLEEMLQVLTKIGQVFMAETGLHRILNKQLYGDLGILFKEGAKV